MRRRAGATQPLCRPKRAWSYIVNCDSNKIDYKAVSLGVEMVFKGRDLIYTVSRYL